MFTRAREWVRGHAPRLYSQLQSIRRRILSARPHRRVFRKMYATNAWGSDESRSGKGSTLETTVRLRQALPLVLAEFEIRVLLDIPCGDHNWMSQVDLADVEYVGADVVPEVVASATQRFAGRGKRFEVVNLLAGGLPKADGILCRDCLVHFHERDIWKALRNIRASGAKYLLATTFPDHDENVDIVTGLWRPLNLERPPFSFPPPLAVITEYAPDSSELYKDKTLALWAVSDLPTR